MASGGGTGWLLAGATLSVAVALTHPRVMCVCVCVCAAACAATYHQGKDRSYGELFKEGDTVGVELDMDAGTLRFRL